MQLDERSSAALNELCTYFNCGKSEVTRKAFAFLDLYKSTKEKMENL